MNHGKNKMMKEIYEKVDDLWEEEVRFLQHIGRFPSTLGNEGALQSFFANYFKNELKLEVDSFVPDVKELSVHPAFSVPEWSYEGRPVVIGSKKGKRKKTGKSLILQGHVDVVSPEPSSAWDYDPWGATIVGDKMYGRGIQDMKSGIAAMIFAYRAVKEAGYELGADLSFQTVIEEECTGNGALAALMRGYKADGALIPEPFAQKAVISQIGVIWLRVKVKGSGAHTERAYQAVNAIEKGYIIIKALETYRNYINNRRKHKDYKDHPHPLNVNVGTFHSGDWPSSVPSECVLEARVGFYPDENPADIKQEVKRWLLEAAVKDSWLKKNPPEITFYGFHADGVSLDQSLELFEVLRKSHEETSHTPFETTSITCTTDIRFFNLYFGIPATCYGPAGGNMHGSNEWVDLRSMKEVTKVYSRFLTHWCNAEKENKQA
ncbi:ArgE/DapE family deacylase [Thalassobacillus sp. C254]|uniref:ArgE/DapE family deacylase n=1 Tax=Thalassobacillus sp. C254 TaxID=1225341 RepID=UPI000B0D4667|nr:ArgE/DapE family deacylase [Thalassobacillus sp. C254]